MTAEEKARKYDEIVHAWNRALADDRGEVWYLIAGFFLANDIQGILADDLDEVITTK